MQGYLTSYQLLNDSSVHQPWVPFAFFFVTLAVNIWILSRGISGGIEKLARIGMPILFHPSGQFSKHSKLEYGRPYLLDEVALPGLAYEGGNVCDGPLLLAQAAIVVEHLAGNHRDRLRRFAWRQHESRGRGRLAGRVRRRLHLDAGQGQGRTRERQEGREASKDHTPVKRVPAVACRCDACWK